MFSHSKCKYFLQIYERLGVSSVCYNVNTFKNRQEYEEIIHHSNTVSLMCDYKRTGGENYASGR